MVEPVSKAPKPRTLRAPTGKPSWPILLLAGREKAGKSYQAALASTSDLVDRTFWVGFGEKDPDEYGAIPGARFEIAEHNGTLRDFTETLAYLHTIERDDKPHLLVVDSVSQVWETLRDKATFLAERRDSRDKNGDVVVGSDLWNRVTREWRGILKIVKRWPGPVIFTARLDEISVFENGKPTKAKTERIQGNKALPFDVDAIVEMPERGRAELTGVRSVTFNLPERTEVPDFTVDALWRLLGLDEADTAPATFTEAPEGDPDGELERAAHVPE